MRLVGLWLMWGCLGLGGCSILDSGGGSNSRYVPGASGSLSGSSLGSSSIDAAETAGDSLLTPALDALLYDDLAAFRSRQGRRAQTRSALLEQAAQDLADVMARKDELSHSADGQRAGDRIKAAGYVTCNQGKPWSENIAMASVRASVDDLARTLMDGWEASPGHRQNMLGAFADVGLAVAPTANGRRFYAVQVFATPGPGRCLE